MSRNIGISIDDDLTRIAVDSGDVLKTLPTVISSARNEDKWKIGEEAYAETLSGNASLIDHLISLARKHGTATIGNIKYTASDILYQFFSELLSNILSKDESDGVAVVALREPLRELFLPIKNAFTEYGYREENIHIISYDEAFARFVLKQEKTLFARCTGLFELSEKKLVYYELKVSGGINKFALTGKEISDEAFSLEILKTPSGIKIADRILTSWAERILNNRIYSSVFICGKGFQDNDLFSDFMKLILKKRRVLKEAGLFSIGAFLYAVDISEGKSEYTVLSDTRLVYDIAVKTQIKGHEENLVLIHAGESFVNAQADFEFILDGQDYLDFVIVPVLMPQNQKTLRMMLSEIPKRENRTTRIRLKLSFISKDEMELVCEDMGFGAFYEPSGAIVTEKIDFKEKFS